MDLSNTLHHMIYGCPIDSDQPALLASSTDLPQSVQAEWRRSAIVDALPVSPDITDGPTSADQSQSATQAVGLFRVRNGHYLFARAAQDAANRAEPCSIHEYVQLTRSDLNAIGGNIGLLAEHLFYEPIPFFTTPFQTLEPYGLPTSPTWTFDRRVAVISHLAEVYGKGDLRPLLVMLSAALSDRQILITGMPGGTADRLLLMQGLLMLLPVFARLEMTFTTHTRSTDVEMRRRVRVIFSDESALSDPGEISQDAQGNQNGETQTADHLSADEPEGITLVSGSAEAAVVIEATRWHIDFHNDLSREPDMPDWDDVRMPYTEALERIWQKDRSPRTLASEIRAMELAHGVIAENISFQTALAQMAAAYSQDQQVLAGETLPIEQVHAALTRVSPANALLYQQYMKLLLNHAMQQRDPEAARIVTAAMDLDPELDRKLGETFREHLDRQPDAVYFAIRTHLAALLAEAEALATSEATAEPLATSESAAAYSAANGAAANGASASTSTSTPDQTTDAATDGSADDTGPDGALAATAPAKTAEPTQSIGQDDDAAPDQVDQPHQTATETATSPDRSEAPEADGLIPAAPAPTAVLERWLPRLHAAALRSLEIASTDSDNEILLEWLRLIVREPSAYQLNDILQNGISAVQNRAHSDGPLGFQLLQITARRVPEAVQRLLTDEALVNALADPLSTALEHYTPQAIQDLLAQSRILYLLTLTQAASAASAEMQSAEGDDTETTAVSPLGERVFTPEIIEQIWLLYTEENNRSPASHPYHPGRLLQTLLTDGLTWLSGESLTRLLALMLGLAVDDPLRAYTPQLIRESSAKDETSLATALQTSNVPQDSVLNIVGVAVNENALTPEQAVDTYFQMIDAQAWNRSALPLGEQVVRTLQHNPALDVAPEQTWKLLSFGTDTRSELITRVIARRTFSTIEKRENEKELVEQFTRLYDLTLWNSAVRQQVLNQWREFCRQQTTARLQQIEKQLEGRKSTEDGRVILQTVLALRRVFNKRSFEEFAEAVAMTYSILQGLSDAFDPAPKSSSALDPVTLRQELDVRRDELTPDERRVLAKNLKELNGLIGVMNEHRSRATLIRREEELERQLLSGEYTPQSAMDMLKWLSGYLDDSHKAQKS